MEAAVSNVQGVRRRRGTEPWWREVLAPYAKPRLGRSFLDFMSSAVPYLGLSTGMYFLLDVSYWLVLLVAVPAAEASELKNTTIPATTPLTHIAAASGPARKKPPAATDPAILAWVILSTALFHSIAPSGFSAGLNFYAYADGNPVSLLDLFGLGAGNESSWSWLAGAGIGVLRFAGSMLAAVNSSEGIGAWRASLSRSDSTTSVAPAAMAADTSAQTSSSRASRPAPPAWTG